MLISGRNRVRALGIAVTMHPEATEVDVIAAGLRDRDPVVEVYGPGEEQRTYGLSADGVPILLGTQGVVFE